MGYIKKDEMFIFTDIDGKEIFKSKSIALLTVQSKIVMHGMTDKVKAQYIQMMQSGQQVSCAESDGWDVDELNKQTLKIPPVI